MRLAWLYSAELLARLRVVVPRVGPRSRPKQVCKGCGICLSLGGVNVILAGDMWQLPPPRGTFLGDVPWEWLTQCKTKRRYKKVAHTIHPRARVDLGQGPGRNPWHDRTGRVRAHLGYLVAEFTKRSTKRCVI